MINADGVSVDNFRIEYLRADYLIRVYDSDGNIDTTFSEAGYYGTPRKVYEDYYIISTPKITHQNLSATRSVTCEHVSSLLRTKSLGLVFSDTEGNNVGTAQDILATILGDPMDGNPSSTGWKVGYVEKFYEDDDPTKMKIKVRSLIASERTGAFNLISKLCDLFEAKPIFHGDTKKVDIIHMNPFSEPENGELPDVTKADGVFELHYGKNIKSVTKTLNTDNIVTRLHAYGCPVGNNATKYCAIEDLKHNEYVFRSDVNIPDNSECMFQAIDNMGYTRTRYFIAHANKDYYNGIPAGSDLIWSTLDYASMSYIFDVYNNVAYKLYETRQTDKELKRLSIALTYVKTNYVSALMDFDYYDEVGLFTDEHRNVVAKYQRQIGN